MWWNYEGAEYTYKEQVKRVAYASRYGRTGDWIFKVSGEFLQDFVEALGEIVEEENRGGQ